MNRISVAVVPLLLALGLSTQLFSGDQSSPQPRVETRMTPQEVVAAAEKKAVLRGFKPEYYSFKPPTFRPRTKDWEVIFIHKGFVPDSTFSVVVNDADGASCVILTLSSGSCT